jgi:hypothetical protein
MGLAGCTSAAASGANRWRGTMLWATSSSHQGAGSSSGRNSTGSPSSSGRASPGTPTYLNANGRRLRMAPPVAFRPPACISRNPANILWNGRRVTADSRMGSGA